jgi:hypothetical protein
MFFDKYKWFKKYKYFFFVYIVKKIKVLYLDIYKDIFIRIKVEKKFL